MALVKKRSFINKRNSVCLVPCRVCGFRYHIFGITFRRAYACWVFPLASFVLPLCRDFFCCCFYFIACLVFLLLFVSFCNNTRSALGCSLALTPSSSLPYSLCLPELPLPVCFGHSLTLSRSLCMPACLLWLFSCIKSPLFLCLPACLPALAILLH